MPLANSRHQNLDAAAIEAEYRQFRASLERMARKVSEKLDRRTFDLAVERLGLNKGRALLIRSETQMSVLMDYALYEIRVYGHNAVERFMEESPPAKDSDDFNTVVAMLDSVCTIVVLEERVPGLGFHVRDMLTDERYLLADFHLAGTGEPGLTLLTRLFVQDSFCCTGGAALPFARLKPSEVERTALDFKRMARPTIYGMPDFGPLIKEMLKARSDLLMQTRGIESYGEESEAENPELDDFEEPYSGPPRLDPYRAPAATIGRNERCPCGSGKKFKQCCLRKAK